MIIWNTDDVFLEDVNPFTGNPSSDIYVKGWGQLTAAPADRCFAPFPGEMHLSSSAEVDRRQDVPVLGKDQKTTAKIPNSKTSMCG